MVRKIKATKDEMKVFLGEEPDQINSIVKDLMKIKEIKKEGDVFYTFDEPFVLGNFNKKGVKKNTKTVLLEDLGPMERILKLSGKSGKRAEICKILITKGEISRDDVKNGKNPLNKWGDMRFLLDDGIIEEIQREGNIIYILNDNLRNDLKGVKR